MAEVGLELRLVEQCHGDVVMIEAGQMHFVLNMEASEAPPVVMLLCSDCFIDAPCCLRERMAVTTLGAVGAHRSTSRSPTTGSSPTAPTCMR